MRSPVRFFFLAILCCAIFSGRRDAVASPAERDFARAFVHFNVCRSDCVRPVLGLRTVNGGTTTLEAFRGKWVVLNFWAIWCPSCLAELPSLAALRAARAGERFAVLLVSLDAPADVALTRERMIRSGLDPETPTLYADDTVWDSVSLAGLPTTLILDPEGRVRYRMEGGTDWTGQETLAFFDEILEGAAGR